LRDAKGNFLSTGNDQPLVFDSLSDAEKYCNDTIARIPSLGCRIHDHTGAIARTLSDQGTYKRHHGRPSAKRNLMIGAACLTAGVGGVALDAWLGWRLTFGVILGVRFLWVGSVRMMDGIAVLMDERAETLRS